MRVTQDYKILTLTAPEHVAVRTALAERELRLNDLMSKGSDVDTNYRDHMLRNLAPVQSALAKVIS